MASFDAQIANYAGTIGSEDTQTALENGVKDVVNRMMKISPDSMFMFSGIEKNSSGESYVTITDTDKILGVTRLKETTNVARNCIEVPPTLRGEVGDTTSLHAATKEYPIYYKLDGKIYVVPDYGTEDKLEVNKVVYGAVTNKDSSNSAIANFPTGMIPLVIIYASAKVILEKMAEITLPTDVSFSNILSAAVDVPNAPSFNLKQSAIFGNSGEFDATSLDLPGSNDLPSIDATFAMPTPDITFADGVLDDSEDQKLPSTWFHLLGEFIENEEDIELARAQVDKINAYNAFFQQALQEKLQKFNADWQTYNQRLTNSIQIMFKQTDTDIQDYASSLQRFQADWDRVVKEVGALGQDFTLKIQKDTTDMKFLADRYLFLMGEYEKAFQPYADKGEQAT